jgi:hypothetical protein
LCALRLACGLRGKFLNYTFSIISLLAPWFIGTINSITADKNYSARYLFDDDPGLSYMRLVPKLKFLNNSRLKTTKNAGFVKIRIFLKDL